MTEQLNPFQPTQESLVVDGETIQKTYPNPEISGFYREMLPYEVNSGKYRGVSRFEEEYPDFKKREGYNENREAAKQIDHFFTNLGEALDDLYSQGFKSESLLKIDYLGRQTGNYGNKPTITLTEIINGDNQEVATSDNVRSKGDVERAVGAYRVLWNLCRYVPLDERFPAGKTFQLGAFNQELTVYLNDIKEYYQKTYHADQRDAEV